MTQAFNENLAVPQKSDKQVRFDFVSYSPICTAQEILRRTILEETTNGFSIFVSFLCRLVELLLVWFCGLNVHEDSASVVSRFGVRQDFVNKWCFALLLRKSSCSILCRTLNYCADMKYLSTFIRVLVESNKRNGMTQFLRTFKEFWHTSWGPSSSSAEEASRQLLFSHPFQTAITSILRFQECLLLLRRLLLTWILNHPFPRPLLDPSCFDFAELPATGEWSYKDELSWALRIGFDSIPMVTFRFEQLFNSIL